MSLCENKHFLKEEDKSYLNYVKDSKVLPAPILKATIKKYYDAKDLQTKNQLKNIIFSSLQKLIIKISCSVLKDISNPQFSLMDLVMEGNLCITYALNLYISSNHKNGYNPNKNTAPSTYFSLSLYNYLTNYVRRNTDDIATTQLESSKIRRVKTVYNIAEKENISIEDALSQYNKSQKTLPKSQRFKLTIKDLAIYNVTYNSIDSTIIYDSESEKDITLGETIQDSNINLEQTLIENELNSIVKNILVDPMEFELFMCYKDNVEDSDSYYKAIKALAKKYRIKIIDAKRSVEESIKKLKKSNKLRSALGVNK